MVDENGFTKKPTGEVDENGFTKKPTVETVGSSNNRQSEKLTLGGAGDSMLDDWGSMNKSKSDHQDSPPRAQKPSPKKPSSQKKSLDPFMRASKTFTQLIHDGVSLNFTVAIDFTISNNPPEKTNSLHYISEDGILNPYQQVIQAIGSIIVNYDSERIVSVIGFGAKVKFPGFDPDKTNHCFACNGNLKDSTTFNQDGFDGLFEAYYRALKNTQFYGPT